MLYIVFAVLSAGRIGRIKYADNEDVTIQNMLAGKYTLFPLLIELISNPSIPVIMQGRKKCSTIADTD